jgi:SAM-dependent methyltransferase
MSAASTREPTIWALGDYDRFARATVWPLGPILVRRCAIGPGQRVLDVAAGSGNVAIRAATAGASVVAVDLTPELFEAGRRGAAAEGVGVEWIEANAETLPFDDGGFDVVTSCFGAMFAPHHQRVADELVRVCRPGGTIGLVGFTPEGIGGEFFALLAQYAPAPPADAEPPLLWGNEGHVRQLFGDRLADVQATREAYVERAASAAAYCQLFSEAFGPIVAIRAGLGARPAALAAFDRALLDSAIRWNHGRAGGPLEIAYEYLMVVVTTRR